MRSRITFRRFLPALLLLSVLSCSHWSTIQPGVRYSHVQRDDIDVHVTRIDLHDRSLSVVVSDEAYRGATVSEVAAQYDAIVAINGDYFAEDQVPVGLSISSCGRWKSAGSARRQWILALSPGRAEILHPESLDAPVAEWIDQAVSGWPVVVSDCRALSSEELPGSDFFTRAPHPRTAVGIDPTGRYLFLVVADGRRDDVPGMTLPELGSFMRDELGVCSALNLDGGGSTEMVLEEMILNQPSDGDERKVGNHLLVIPSSATIPCVDRVDAME